MAESHGKREFIGGGELAPRPETAAQMHGQVCQRWQCGDFATAELHGTREFVGGGELAPHPETAAQTHGRRQPFETGV